MVHRARRTWGLSPPVTCSDSHMCRLVSILLMMWGFVSGSSYDTQCHRSYYHLPDCMDHPDGYGCKCGPGFIWNSRMCVASGLDSHLNFDSTTPLRYTELTKPFPELESFTIAFWIKLQSTSHPGTVLSYASQKRSPNVLRITTGPSLTFKVHEEEIKPLFRLNISHWTHLAWTWNSRDGSWRAYLNGGALTSKGRASRSDRPIPGGGDLVLGQSSRTPSNEFDLDYAFVGEVAFVNIWHRVMRLSEIKLLYDDCKMMRCGNVVEWADFRSGTRGAMKISWPSNIYKKPCFDDDESSKTCDRHCSFRIGAQCNEEFAGNIRWLRTAADHNATVKCPGVEQTINSTKFAYRECVRTSDTDGRWRDPLLTECTSPLFLNLTQEVKTVTVPDLSGLNVLNLSHYLEHISSEETVNNPVDIAVTLDVMKKIINAQTSIVLSHNESQLYGLNRRTDRQSYPSLENTYNFTMSMMQILNNLLKDDNDDGWLGAEPKGNEGNKMLNLLETLDTLVVKSLDFHISRGDMAHSSAELAISQSKLLFKVKYYPSRSLDHIHFPLAADFHSAAGIHDIQGYYLNASRDVLLASINSTNIPDHIITSTGWFMISKTVPNRNLTGKYTKEDNVNSALFYMTIHDVTLSDSQSVVNLTEHGVEMKFVYVDNFNISNPECVRLVHGNSSFPWHWSREGCRLAYNTTKYSVCHCQLPGIFAVTTDMYNIDWDQGEEPMILLDIPSYIGCSLSALLCLMTIILLMYYKTSSKTAALHKNFALSVIFSQMSFMFGVDRVEHELVCHAFAITFHYFFLSTFFWLMNEAFNLYIVITYAAHSHGEHTEGGSQWRYYILGWILPGILVGAFVGTHQEDYYSDSMCWIAWHYVWLFLGPAIGVISVTILVLIFIAKEHHETAYSKNEQTNNMIIMYSKALWTQTILLCLSWSFAFLSIKMRGIIIKCLYALFNGLQGSFFIVFYFLLHDEVQTIIKARVKKKSLASQGYDYSNASSIEDSLAFAHEMEEMNSPGISGSVSVRRIIRNERPKNAQYSSSEDEDDEEDCDVLVTAV